MDLPCACNMAAMTNKIATISSHLQILCLLESPETMPEEIPIFKGLYLCYCFDGYISVSRDAAQMTPVCIIALSTTRSFAD